jgi:hypothetical protein
MIAKLIGRSFAAAAEENVAPGGLFGLGGEHAKAFCNVIGQSPAASAIAKGFGKFVAVATLVVDGAKAAAKNTIHLAGSSPRAFCP